MLRTGDQYRNSWKNF